MQFKSIAEGDHSVALSTFIKLPFVTKTFILSIFEWLFYTRFNVSYSFQGLHVTDLLFKVIFCKLLTEVIYKEEMLHKIKTQQF